VTGWPDGEMTYYWPGATKLTGRKKLLTYSQQNHLTHN